MKKFSEEEIPLIKKHFSGRLSPEEQARIQTKISDPDYEQELVFYQALFSAIEDAEDERLKNLMRASTTERTPSTHQTAFPYIWWAVAATLIIGGGLLVWQLTAPKLPAYFEPYPVISSNTNDRGNAPKDLFRFYESGKYRKALKYFDEIEGTLSTNFYKSIALIAERRSGEAIPLLEPIVIKEESVYAIPARYYLGLAYFHNGDRAEARTWLTQAIEAPTLGDRYKSEIEALLAKLED